MDTIKFGNLLKELRSEKKLTQEQLAERFGVSNRTVSRWETGINLPDMDTLLALSDFYGVEVRALLCGERKDTCAQSEEKELLRRTADYCDRQSKQKMRVMLWTVVLGVLAAGSEIYMALRFTQSIKGFGVVVFITVFLLFVFVLCMRKGRYGKSADGKIKTLCGAFLSVLLSNVFLFFLLNGNRYGVDGVYYVFGVAAAVFVTVGVLMSVFYGKL